MITAGEVRGVSLGEPSVRFDITYMFLAFVGFLYLSSASSRSPASAPASAVVFWALCLASFGVYVLTPAGPRDTLWKMAWVAEDVYRAFLPALLLHFFLVFPRPIRERRVIPVLYLPAAAYIPAEIALLSARPTPLLGGRARGRDAVLVRLLRRVRRGGSRARWRQFVRRHREDAEADKQVRWIGLGVIGRPRAVPDPVGAAAGLRPRIPAAVERRRRAARLHPARLRLRDPQVAPLGRRDLRARGDRDDGRRAARRHDVRAAELASRPDARRHGRRPARTSSRSPRAWCWLLCSFRSRSASPTSSSGSSTTTPTARGGRCSTSPATSRRRGRAKRSSRRSSNASRRPSASFPARSSCSRARGRDPDAAALAEALGRRGPAAPARHGLRRGAPGGASAPPRSRLPGLLRDALRREARRRPGRRLQGRPHAALLGGRGPADGGARPGEPRLRERPPLRRARRAARGDPHAPGVPGERHPLLLVGHRRCSTPTSGSTRRTRLSRC